MKEIRRVDNSLFGFLKKDKIYNEEGEVVGLLKGNRVFTPSGFYLGEISEDGVVSKLKYRIGKTKRISQEIGERMERRTVERIRRIEREGRI